MIRKALQWLEFSALVAIQLALISFCLLILLSSPAQSQNTPPAQITDFLSQIGGDTKIKSIGTPSSPERRFVEDHPEQLGFRTIKDKNKDALQTANLAVAAFARECAQKGGILDEDSAPHVHFLLARQQELTKGYGSDVWGYQHRVAVCSRDQNVMHGRMIAIILDKTPYGRKYKGDLVGGMLSGTLSNQTLIVALPPNNAESRDAIARLDTSRIAGEQARSHQSIEDDKARAVKLAEWRKNLKIGDESNCGAVIEVRGPIAQVASGAQTYWVRRELLYPAGYRLHPSGLQMTCVATY